MKGDIEFEDYHYWKELGREEKGPKKKGRGVVLELGSGYPVFSWPALLFSVSVEGRNLKTEQ